MKSIDNKEVYVFKDGKLLLETKTLEAIITDFAPLVQKVVNDVSRKTNCVCPKEDLLQNANVEVINIFNRYNKKFNITFAHFLKQYLFISLFKKTNLDIQKNNKNICLNENIACDKMDDAFLFIESDIDISHLVNKMPIHHQRILNYKIKGLTQSEISEALQISQSQVSKTLKNIKSKLKNAV